MPRKTNTQTKASIHTWSVSGQLNEMNIINYIQQVQIHLIETHAVILDWFHEDEKIKNYKPDDDGWTISEILEHISLTSHYLLILIDKGADKAIRNVHNLSLEDEIEHFDGDLERFERIGILKSFPWTRPEHMEPTGNKTELEIRSILINQLRKCLNHLEDLKDGKGLLYKTTMTVSNLGKINVYEFIYFLSKHAERHIYQMKENKKEYLERIKADH